MSDWSDKLTLPEKLKDLRMEHSLSLEQLAEATQMSRSALGAYENDVSREIGGENLRTLAEYYHVSADYLLGIINTKNAGETETAPTTSIVEDIKSDLEAYKNFKGSRAEKDFALMCKQRGINYSKVPDDEKMVVLRFLRRPKNFKGYYD